MKTVAGAVFRNDDYITPKYNDIAGPLGLQIDATALIETYADASKIKIYSDGAIETSGQLEVGGVGSTIDIAADAPIILVQLSRVFAEGDDSTVKIVSQDVLSVNSGTSMRVGVKNLPVFEMQTDGTSDNAFGSFDVADGMWSFTLDNTSIADLNVGDKVTDSFTFTSIDGIEKKCGYRD